MRRKKKKRAALSCYVQLERTLQQEPAIFQIEKTNKQTKKSSRKSARQGRQSRGSRTVEFLHIYICIYLFIFVVVCCTLVCKHLIDPQLMVDWVTEEQTSDQNGKMARSYLRVERLSPHLHAVLYVVSPRDRVTMCLLFSILYYLIKRERHSSWQFIECIRTVVLCAAIQKREREGETIHVAMHRSSSTCRVSHNRERREERLPTVKGFHFNFVSSIPSIHLLYCTCT